MTWFAIHAVLGVAVASTESLATVHGFAAIATGAWIALRGVPGQVLTVAAYIGCSDVLWRMADARVPWESGKYGVILVLGLSFLRRARWTGLANGALLYFCLLLPSALLTLAHPDIPRPRTALSFNLSGPACLAVAAVYCATQRFTPRQITMVLLAAMGPLLSIAAITIMSTYFGGPIDFYSESNVATSGGYGPNQVSSVLGLGALLTYLLLIGRRVTGQNSLVLTVLFGIFVVQSAMTFSRGGLYGAALAGVAGGFFLVGDSRARIRLFVAATMVTAVAQFSVLPQLSELTRGALEERFSDVQTTGRIELLVSDLRVGLRRPIAGVGPGVAAYERDSPDFSAAHTEYSRLLAEHGMLGVLALGLLGHLALQTVRIARGPGERAFVLTLIAWSTVTMLHAGMRVAAIGLVFGLAVAGASASRVLPLPVPRRAPIVGRRNRGILPTTGSHRPTR